MFQQFRPSSSSFAAAATASKRGLDEADQHLPPLKRFRNTWHIKLESESSEQSEEDTESVHSIQDQETEYVQDTPDTDTKSESSSADDFEVEYEIASLSEEEQVASECSSGGTDDFLTTAGAIAAALYNQVTTEESSLTDVEDTDDSCSVLGSEVRRTDFWTCIQCKSSNNNPMFRYCRKCFQARKNLFPPRPKRRRRRRSKVFSNKKDDPRKLASQDSGVGSSQSSLPISSTSTNSNGTILQGQMVEVKDEDVSKSSLPEYKELCIMCNVQSKNSIFLHGNIGHMCCCYTCAMRAWRTGKRCPVCNCRVKNVIKVFVT